MLGNNASAANAGAVALGQGSTTAAVVATTGATLNGTAYTFAGGAPGSTVSVGTTAAGGQRTVTNVAAGRISATSTDAINGSELFATNQALASIDFPVRTGDAAPFTTTATGAGSLAVGSNAVANAAGATVIGTGATNNANANATVLGNGASVAAGLAGSNVALGQGSTVAAAAVPVANAAIGGTTYTFAGGTPAGAVSVGSGTVKRQIQNVAAGQLTAASTDAVNGSQLFATNTAVTANGTKVDTLGGNVATALGGGSAYNPATGGLTAPTYTVLGAPTTNVGAAITALQTRAPLQYSTAAAPTTPSPTATPSNDVTLVGAAAGPVGLHNVAAGTTTTDAVNFGQLQTAVANNDFPIRTGDARPYTTAATGAGSLAVGSNAVANAAGATVIGTGATNNANANATVLGNGASVAAGLAGSNVALGQGSTVAAAAVPVAGATIAGTAYTFAGGAPGGAVSFGTAAAPRQLQNVAAGQITATSTDAVNGSQLFATNTAIGTVGGKTDALGGSVATNLGGGATYDPATGAVSAPSYNVYGAPQTNVGAAITALQTGAPLQFSDPAGNPTPQTPSNDVTLVGAAAGPVSLHNIAAGTTTNDAVNFGQLTTAVNAATTHYYSVNDGGVQGGNYANNGATGLNALAAGVGATAATDNSVALGAGATTAAGVNTPNATINGTTYAFAGTTPATAGVVSVGSAGNERQIQNVAAGQITATSTDAVNGSQLFATNTAIGTVGGKTDALGGSVATNLGGGATYDPATGAVSAPSYNVYGAPQTNVGAAITALQTGAPLQFSDPAGNPTPQTPSNDITLVGAAAGPVALHNIAAGTAPTDAVNLSQLTSAITASDVPVRTGDARPYTTAATGAGSLAVGSNAVASAGSTVVGTGATDNGNANATVVGNGASVAAGLAGSNVALGQGSIVTAAAVPVAGATIGGTAYTFAGANPFGALSVGTAGAERQIQNVAAGQLTAGSTDAINGSQLFATNAQVTANTNAINTISGMTGIVQRTGNGNTVAFTAPGGTGAAPGAAQVVTNVAAGGVNPASTDAVNGLQLYGVSQSVANNLGGGSVVNPDGTVSAPNYTVQGNTYNNVGGAIAALDTNLASGQAGPFRSNNAAGAAQPVAAGANSTAGGFGASATGAASTVVGNGASDNGVANATVLGNGAAVAAGLAGSNVALGQGTTATRGAQAGYTAAFATGPQTSAGEVAVGSAAAPRQVTGVAAGSAATDAVNVGQLNGLASRSVQYDTNPDGTANRTSLTLNPGAGPVTIHNVATGTAPGDVATVGQLNTGLSNTVQYQSNPDGTRSNTVALLGGNAAQPVRLTNVAAGTAPTDAVNVGQLNNALSNQYNNLAQLTQYQFQNAKRAINGGVAVALAAATLRFDDRPGKVSLAAGASGYSGAVGVAVGIGGTSEDGLWRYDFLASFSPNESKAAVGVAGGLSYTLN